MLVVIGILTHGRNELLDACLKSVVLQKSPALATIQLILLDNNPEPIAKAVFDSINFPFHTTYIHEPEKGIVIARNRVLREAFRMNADVLGFIDDDESAHSDWVVEGVKNLNDSFDISIGPCEFQFEESAPNWISSTRVFKKREGKSGEYFKAASTRNVFIKLDFFKKHELSFNSAFNETGGSDTLFFKQAKKRGARSYWNSAQHVNEKIPSERSNLRWILKRNLRLGSAKAMRWFHLQNVVLVYVKVFFHGSFTILVGSTQAVLTLWHPYLWVRGLEKGARGIGMLQALLGFPFAEYK